MYTDGTSILSFANIRALFPNVSFPEGGPPASWLRQNGLCTIVETSAPQTAWNEVALPDGIEKIGTKWHQKWTVREFTPEEVDLYKAGLVQHLDETRWKKEQGGITVGGITIPTRDRDKILINGKITEVILKNLPDTHTFTFTLDGQDIVMTVGTLKAIGIAIAEHVQFTVDGSAVARPKIQNGTITNKDDVEAAFEAAYTAQANAVE